MMAGSGADSLRPDTLDRRRFLRLVALSAGSVLLSACGGSSGGPSAQTTPPQLGFEGPPTEAASPSGQPASPSPATSSPPEAPSTPEVPRAFHEAPSLAQLSAAGKLPKVEERLPKHPLVLRPVEGVGRYGGAWHTVLLPSGDTAWLTRTVEYDYLVSWKPDVKAFTIDDIVPNVAERFEIRDGGKEYVFYLREGLRWSDGHPFTADDLLFWYEDVYSNPEITPAQPTWLNVGGKPMKVVKLDDYTVSFQFAVPNGLFLQNLATPSGSTFTNYPAHYMKQFHKKYNPQVSQEVKKRKLNTWVDLFNLMATAYSNPDKPVLYAWRYRSAYGAESTTQFVAERNPYYWKVDPEGNQLPYLDRVVYRLVEKPEVMVLMALNGELDFQDRHINALPNKPVFYRNQQKGGFHFVDEVPSSMNTAIIALNLTTRNKTLRQVFNDVNFRIGLSHAINRQEIIDVLYVSQGEPWQAAPRRESPFFDEAMAKQYTEHDPEKANAYLDKVLPRKDGRGRRLGPTASPSPSASRWHPITTPSGWT